MLDDAQTIEGLVARSGKSYSQLAAECGVSKGTIANWKDKNAVTPGNYGAFAEAVGVSEELVRQISGATKSNRPSPKTDADVAEWMKGVLRLAPHPAVNTILQTFVLFYNPQTGQVTVTHEELAENTSLTIDLLEEWWSGVLESPLIERMSSQAVEARGVWVLRLVMPEAQ